MFDGSTANSLRFSDGYAGIVRFGSAAGVTTQMFKDAVLDNVDVGSFRLSSTSTVPPDSLTLNLRTVNRDGLADRGIEITGSTFPAVLNISADEVHTTGLVDYSVRVDSATLTGTTPIADKVSLKVGRLVGPKKNVVVRGYDKIYVADTDFGDCFLDSRDTAAHVFSVNHCYFNQRNDFEYFVRAEDVLSSQITNNYWRNVTTVGTTSAAEPINVGSTTKYTQGNLQEDSAGVITAYVHP